MFESSENFTLGPTVQALDGHESNRFSEKNHEYTTIINQSRDDFEKFSQ